MKKSFELEDTFRNLNHIPRSEIQKRKTYNAITQTSRPNTDLNVIFTQCTGFFLTLAMVLVSAVFLFTQMQDSVQGQLKQPEEFLYASEVVVTYVTKSVSDDSFGLESNVTRKGVAIVENPAWMKTVSMAVNSKKTEVNAPAMKDAFDVLLVYNNKKPDKCKLWISKNEVYIQPMKDRSVYKIESSEAGFIIRMIEDMEKQVRF